MTEELLAEHDRVPLGRHSTALNAELERLRMLPLPGKHFLFMSKPGEEWMLARISADAPHTLLVRPDVVFTSIDDAERHVFRLRLAEEAGEPDDWSRYVPAPPSPAAVGYAGSTAVTAGDSLGFHVSCRGTDTYSVEILRLLGPDLGPMGPAFEPEVLDSTVSGEHPAVAQRIWPGSFMRADGVTLAAEGTLLAWVHPTRPGLEQVIARHSGPEHAIELVLAPDGRLEAHAVVAGERAAARTDGSLVERRWSLAAVTWTAEGRLAVHLGTRPDGLTHGGVETVQAVGDGVALGSPGDLTMAAESAVVDGVVRCVGRALDGRLAEPALFDRALSADGLASVLDAGSLQGAGLEPALCWELTADFGASEVAAEPAGGPPARFVNRPVRAVRGPAWTGAVLDPRSAPAEYAAMHFHSDDLDDVEWAESFRLDVPESWPSGVYAARISTGVAKPWDIPFFVRRHPSQAARPVLFLAPTATYAAYANMRLRMFSRLVELLHGRLTVLDTTDLLLSVWPELGASTYDMHADGSPVVNSTMRRPVTNFRPTGRIYKLCQDLLIVHWLTQAGIGFDVITDEDLHRDGAAALEGAQVVVTGSHPEYFSDAMYVALDAFTAAGGRLAYLGGNGAYTASEFMPDGTGGVEVRRPGLEALWPIDHTEAYFAVGGRPAGPLKKIGRPAESLFGVGFITQGFDACSAYTRTEASRDPRAAFVFEGVGDGPIGDYGILQGGAAGYEIDRFDVASGSPRHALVVARAETFTNVYDIMAPSVGDLVPPAEGEPSPLRADMVFFETGGGGAVFGVGSIAWCGSLSHNGYDNDVARITENVVRRFADPTPFPVVPGA